MDDVSGTVEHKARRDKGVFFPLVIYLGFWAENWVTIEEVLARDWWRR